MNEEKVSQVSRDKLDDDALDGEFVGIVNDDGRRRGVVASEDDGALTGALFDADSFEGGVVVEEARADFALNEFRVDVRPVLDEDDVVWFECGFHAVEFEAKAVAVGAPEVAEDGEHFELFLCFGRDAGRDSAKEGEFFCFQRLGGVVVFGVADKYCLR